jgi:hypothetical protein
MLAAILALKPDWFDRPVVKGINGFTTDWQFANVLAFVFSGLADRSLSEDPTGSLLRQVSRQHVSRCCGI